MRTDYQKFIILSQPRSGSNYLAYLLGNHPDIISLGELYEHKTIWGQPGKPHLNHNSIFKWFRNYFPVIFLKWFIFHSYPQNIRAVGFRFFYSQIEEFPTVLSYLMQFPIKIIHLKRKNILDNLISFKLAVLTNVWSSLRGSQPDMTFFLDYKECLDFFIETEKMQKKYDKLFVDFQIITVYYEELNLSPIKTINKILNFLDINYIPLSSPLEKQNLRNQNEIVNNFSELKRQFKGSKWEKYFK